MDNNGWKKWMGRGKEVTLKYCYLQLCSFLHNRWRADGARCRARVNGHASRNTLIVDFDSDSMATEHCTGLYLFQAGRKPLSSRSPRNNKWGIRSRTLSFKFPAQRITFYLYLTKTDYWKFFATFVCRIKIDILDEKF